MKRAAKLRSLMTAMVLLPILATACGMGEGVTPEEPTARAAGPTQSPAAVATLPPTDASATPTNPAPPPVTPTPATALPSATPAPLLDSWYLSGSVALFVAGDEVQADVLALGSDGTTRVVLPGVRNDAAVSPNGRWLGYVRWNETGGADLVLHDARTGETRQIVPEMTGGMLSFAFDPSGDRLVYMDLGPYTSDGVPWALAVMDLDTGMSVRYTDLMASPEDRPLPGAPVGWSHAGGEGEELVIDTFVPYSEGGSMGVWSVTLPVDRAAAALDSLPMRELIPAAPVYSSRVYVAPDGGSAAFLGRDSDYLPANYAPQFYDLAVNRLGIASLEDGARTTIVEASDGSALARVLAWSPNGERLLFAQGYYDGENMARLSLKSTDRAGTVVEYGPLVLPPLGGLLELAWCNPSLALFVTWDGRDGTEQLRVFDLNTGVSTEVSTAPRLSIAGCAP